MESKIFCLVAFLALSAGVAFAQAQISGNETTVDTNTTTVASPSNSSEPTTTVSNTTVPTTATPSTATVPSSAVPSTEVPTATAAGSNTTDVPTAGNTTANTTEAINGTTTLTPSSTTATPCTSHSFDAASFVGGIVLGLGVCIIVFFFYKWYQSRHPTAAPYQQF